MPERARASRRAKLAAQDVRESTTAEGSIDDRRERSADLRRAARAATAATGDRDLARSEHERRAHRPGLDDHRPVERAGVLARVRIGEPPLQQAREHELEEVGSPGILDRDWRVHGLR